MEKTKETSDREQSNRWWWNLKMRDKWALFFKYNPLIADTPSNISLDLKTVDPDHIKSIWKKESGLTPQELREEIDKYVFNKPNKKQFVEFNEDLFLSYINKFSDLGKRKAIEMLLKNCDFQKAELIKDNFNLKLQITKF